MINKQNEVHPINKVMAFHIFSRCLNDNSYFLISLHILPISSTELKINNISVYVYYKPINVKRRRK